MMGSVNVEVETAANETKQSLSLSQRQSRYDKRERDECENETSERSTGEICRDGQGEKNQERMKHEKRKRKMRWRQTLLEFARNDEQPRLQDNHAEHDALNG